jgi:hypothetical protein
VTIGSGFADWSLRTSSRAAAAPTSAEPAAIKDIPSVVLSAMGASVRTEKERGVSAVVV